MEGGKQSLVSCPELFDESDFQHHHRHHRCHHQLAPLSRTPLEHVVQLGMLDRRAIREENKLDLRRGYSRDGSSVQGTFVMKEL
jgi:hypothetical protein